MMIVITNTNRDLKLGPSLEAKSRSDPEIVYGFQAFLNVLFMS